MLNLILSALYFTLPAYVANMAPVAFAKIPFLKSELPLGQPINEKAFGAHKTWRGFYLGYIAAFLVLLLQLYIQKKLFWTAPVEGLLELFASEDKIEMIVNFSQLSVEQDLLVTLLDYEKINLFLYAFIFGIGAITGDLIKSFFKRRIGIKPGGVWFPFDQLDFIVGFLLFMSPFYIPSWQIILTIIIVTPLVHFLANFIGYLLGLKKVWW